jgi:hypothetical protein
LGARGLRFKAFQDVISIEVASMYDAHDHDALGVHVQVSLRS